MGYKFQNLLPLLELHGIDVLHAVKRVDDLQNGKLVPVGTCRLQFLMTTIGIDLIIWVFLTRVLKPFKK